MHYQENLQQNVEIIQLSVHMFEESLGKKYLCWTKWDEIISEFAFFYQSIHYVLLSNKRYFRIPTYRFSVGGMSKVVRI